jgi:integrase/recombinase XerD
VIKHYVDWCLQNDLPPLQAKRPHIELFVRWCESQPWSESYICQHFVGVRSIYKTCVRDDVLLRNPAEFVDAPKVHEEGQKRTFLTPLGKGGKPADIPLPVPAMRAVRVVVDGRTAGPLLLHRAGNALTTLDARRMVNRIARTAGCRHITPHGLRRTFCTTGLVSGVPMRDMQIAMRHADPTPPGCTTWPRTTRTGTPVTASRRSSPAMTG